MHIVLHEPGIALNTGNIGRTCAATDTSLHLIRPYGFRLSEKEIRRAGMDYWETLDVHEYINYEDFCAQIKESHPASRIFLATTKGERLYTEVVYGPDDFIMLGNESRGIPEEILHAHPADCIRIPMWGSARSLNLANAAAIVLYEALRQQGFDGMRREPKAFRN